MNIEIRKVQFANKGAALMLYAVLNMMRKIYPEADYVVEPNIRSPFKKRGALELLQKASYRRHKIQWGALAAWLPANVRKLFGLVLDREIDIVLDAAGFAYSEQIGRKSCSELARSCKRWKKRGTKVILLPQAFGPFNSNRIKKDIKIVAEKADIIFARDKVSYDHLLNAVGYDKKIKIAPDFTNLLKGKLPQSFDKDKYNFCIVPNARMLNKLPEQLSSKYIPFMTTCIKYLLKRGQRPFILVHGEKSDIQLAEDIVRSVGQEIMIMEESDPVKVKGIIGACDGVIGSRYHSLVSSLSQNIPALGTSWSHKYQMLYDDYGFSEGLIDVDADTKIIHDRIDKILDPVSNQEIKLILEAESNKMKKTSEMMWKTVINIINTKDKTK